jgi:hypothetical protein
MLGWCNYVPLPRPNHDVEAIMWRIENYSAVAEAEMK